MARQTVLVSERRRLRYGVGGEPVVGRRNPSPPKRLDLVWCSEQAGHFDLSTLDTEQPAHRWGAVNLHRPQLYQMCPMGQQGRSICSRSMTGLSVARGAEARARWLAGPKKHPQHAMNLLKVSAPYGRQILRLVANCGCSPGCKQMKFRAGRPQPRPGGHKAKAVS